MLEKEILCLTQLTVNSMKSTFPSIPRGSWLENLSQSFRALWDLDVSKSLCFNPGAQGEEKFHSWVTLFCPSSVSTGVCCKIELNTFRKATGQFYYICQKKILAAPHSQKIWKYVQKGYRVIQRIHFFSLLKSWSPNCSIFFLAPLRMTATFQFPMAIYCRRSQGALSGICIMTCQVVFLQGLTMWVLWDVNQSW